MGTDQRVDRRSNSRPRMSRVSSAAPSNGAARREARAGMLIDYLSYALGDVRSVSPANSYLLETLIEAIKQELAPSDAMSSGQAKSA